MAMGMPETPWDVFGPQVSGEDVEQHVVRTLKHWLETYLRERELLTGRDMGSVARPKSWLVAPTSDDRNPEDQFPMIMVNCTGLAGVPLQEGDGSFRAPWEISVSVLLSAKTMADSQSLVKGVYCPAIRMILLQKQSLRQWEDPNAKPISDGIEWTDEGYQSPLGNESADQTLFQGQITANVWMGGIVNRYDGPKNPADEEGQPGSHWPQVLKVDVRPEDVKAKDD